ncbi:37S ribosomal protein S22 [Malassezia cuniculi]|uniref:37S ribosomal protein S22 n=1 Tax=Malassezia cuniculi TaxID=948313 RepID=A0AAF0F100_9BASI|nr:37S ribosomal protein S22 [Malassezia cuniculi]
MRHTRLCAQVAVLSERTTREAQLRVAAELSEIVSARENVAPAGRVRSEPLPSSVQRLSEAARLTSRRADGQWWSIAPAAMEKSITRALQDTDKKQLRRDVEHIAELWKPEKSCTISDSNRYLESMPDGRAVSVHLASQFMNHYAAISTILEETSRRIGGPIKKVVDYGSGAAVGLWAAMRVFDIKMYVGEAKSAPMMRAGIALLNVEDLRQRLRKIHTVFRLTSDKPVPHKRGAQHEPSVGADETLALSAYALSPMSTDSMRERHIDRIWKSRAQVIVLVEEANPRGFASIAAARAQLLQYGRTSGHPIHVVAPCAHDKPCPMLHAYGMSKSSRAPKLCAFKQAYHAPKYQKMAENTPKTERMSRFTYVVLARGERPSIENTIARLTEQGVADADTKVQNALLQAKGGILDDIRASPPEAEILASEEQLAAGYEVEPLVEHEIESRDEISDQTDSEHYTEAHNVHDSLEPVQPSLSPASEFSSAEAARIDSYSWPRLIDMPLKKGGHVTIDACCPTGDLRRFTIAKSKGRQAYQDARKLRGSELYAHAHVSSRPSIISPAAVTDPAAHDSQAQAMPTEIDSGDLAAFFAEFGSDLAGDRSDAPSVLETKRIERVREAEHIYIGPEAQMQASTPGERNPLRRTRRGPKKRIAEVSERGTRTNRKISRSALDAELQDQW